MARAGEFAGFGRRRAEFSSAASRGTTGGSWFERHRAEYETGGARPAPGAGGGDGRPAGPPSRPSSSGDPRRSIFRIHRDVRFSARQVTLQDQRRLPVLSSGRGARGAGQDADGAGAGLYFQLADGECFVAGGIWMPARPSLDRIREAIAARPRGARRICPAPAFRRRFRELDARGDAQAHAARLRREPPAAGWLRYQSFTATRDLDGAGGAEPAAPRRSLARDFAALVPLVRWLNRSDRLPSRDRRF